MPPRRGSTPSSTGRSRNYRTARDFPGRAATSRLSENLTLGEIGPRRVWWRVQRLLEQERGHRGAEHFLKELAWRDFAHHLIFHTPEIATGNWRAEWDAFPWRDDNEDAERWRRGLTGEPLVDAGMREMYVTGTMHNRARMIVASYLTKHLMTHWRVGLAWFEACLIDWDPASNALGWQWVAGSGPDAAPYFRVFNPATQAEKFDPDESYRRRFVAELTDAPGEDARAWFDAVPRSWKLDPEAAYPEPMIDLKAGRQRALDAYERHRSG
jgi:deoxyribodipyrimidine photo-lyase